MWQAQARFVQASSPTLLITLQEAMTNEGKSDDDAVVLCSRNSHHLFHANWSKNNKIRMTPPKGFPDAEFTWRHFRDISNLKVEDQTTENDYAKVTKHN